MVSLTNSKELVASSVSVVDKGKVIDLKEICFIKIIRYR